MGLSSELRCVTSDWSLDQPVNSPGGASAFIYDYFRLRVGRSAEENLAKIQSEDIPALKHGPGEPGPASQPKEPSLYTSPGKEANSSGARQRVAGQNGRGCAGLG